MLIIKSFFRKRNNSLYFLINMLVFLVIFTLFLTNEYLLNRYDKDYQDAYINIISTEKLKLGGSSYIINEELKENNKYIYEIKLKHWYDADNQVKNIIKEIDKNIIEIDGNYSYFVKDELRNILGIFDIVKQILICGYLVFIVIVVINVIVDSKKNILLLRYLGFRRSKIIIFTILQILLLFLIPFVVLFTIYKILLNIV